MINHQPFFEHLKRTPLEKWLTHFQQVVNDDFEPERHGDFARWNEVLDKLPTLHDTRVNFDQSAVTANPADPLSEKSLAELKESLLGLHPWRKGPFSIGGVDIDTEWRSDWKWDRVLPHISPLKNRTVLDVGCGSGYHMWRMCAEDPAMVIGIDPSLLFMMQFYAIQHFVGQQSAYYLPIGIEAMPKNMRSFCTVFSMGVLYHRRSPMDHLIELRELLRPGGELVLETLVIDGGLGDTLVPSGRYARMGNVWFLPSPDTMMLWLEKCGFKNVRMVDCAPTALDEQRATEWMTFQSLGDFLDPDDVTKTIEGYPAPKRAVFVATAAR
ncbi:tRNA 5-methoxyuridine(34)/uridine 5-oxyacetic acid(34) synthase CmoB [Gammaproteobacteria bacterium 45_16_T64]|nr:tRNA 5-methoxyuridine(34)/uridine 5-oxyacetic acid(34) synthase CmoB [Gammaproteobacteria bacterium 45_16_T64]